MRFGSNDFKCICGKYVMYVYKNAISDGTILMVKVCRFHGVVEPILGESTMISETGLGAQL